MPAGQYFVLDRHGGPPVRTRAWNEFGRGWSVHTAKHNSVEGREANLTLLYRHTATGFEVYFLNTLTTPNGEIAIVLRKYQ